MDINKEYIILFWIIALLLFTFYCIFRLKYISEKYDDIPNSTQTTVPQNTVPQDIITYIDNVQSKNKITDMPNCSNIYDDNYKVQELGYTNCETAYSDYLNKNFDIYNKYGKDKSLAEICPVSSKTNEYSQCLQTLLHKFHDNSTILDNINVDMTSSINKRLDDRTHILDNIDIVLNPFIYSKEQNEFHDNMLINKQIAKYPYERLGLVDTYYQDRYQSGIGIEPFQDKISNKKLINETFTNIVDPDIIRKYFGKYKAVTGQFLALNNLMLSIEYDTTNTNTNTNNNNNLNTKKIIDKIIINTITPTMPSKVNIMDVNAESLPVLFTISNNDLYIVYKIIKIDNYKNIPNAIEIIINNKSIIKQTNENNLVEPLLSILGITTPTKLVLVYDEFTSSENIKHTTYKLVNDNLDTILVLNKI